MADKVVGVEIVEEAVEAAKENAAGNGLKNCEFIAGDVLNVIGELKDKPDLIILTRRVTVSTRRRWIRSSTLV